jgi:hypothetical protein
MKEFYSANFVSVFYDTETDALWVKYFQRVPSDEHFVPVVNAMLNGFLSLNTQKFVADIRKMGVLGMESQNLIVTKLLPGMLNHLRGKKLYHAQLVDSREVMCKVAADNVKRKTTNEDVEIVQFTDQCEAVNYIKTLSL